MNKRRRGKGRRGKKGGSQNKWVATEAEWKLGSVADRKLLVALSRVALERNVHRPGRVPVVSPKFITGTTNRSEIFFFRIFGIIFWWNCVLSEWRQPNFQFKKKMAPKLIWNFFVTKIRWVSGRATERALQTERIFFYLKKKKINENLKWNLLIFFFFSTPLFLCWKLKRVSSFFQVVNCPPSLSLSLSLRLPFRVPQRKKQPKEEEPPPEWTKKKKNRLLLLRNRSMFGSQHLLIFLLASVPLEFLSTFRAHGVAGEPAGHVCPTSYLKVEALCSFQAAKSSSNVRLIVWRVKRLITSRSNFPVGSNRWNNKKQTRQWRNGHKKLPKLNYEWLVTIVVNSHSSSPPPPLPFFWKQKLRKLRPLCRGRALSHAPSSIVRLLGGPVGDLMFIFVSDESMI